MIFFFTKLRGLRMLNCCLSCYCIVFYFIFLIAICCCFFWSGRRLCIGLLSRASNPKPERPPPPQGKIPNPKCQILSNDRYNIRILQHFLHSSKANSIEILPPRRQHLLPRHSGRAGDVPLVHVRGVEFRGI